FPKRVCGGQRRASRWSAAGEPRRSDDQNPKHPMKENQMQSGVGDRLPLVGPEATTELKLSNTKTHFEGKTIQSEGADYLPLVGPKAITELRLSNTSTHCEGKPPQSGGSDCLPLVGPGTQNLIRKETLAAESLRSRLQAHCSMRKCCATQIWTI